MSSPKTPAMVDPKRALPGRSESAPARGVHGVLGTPLAPPYPPTMEIVAFGMGCFWGTEQVFWNQLGVYVTVAGYAGGYTPNPTYDEILTGLTGHAEVALVVHDPMVVSTLALLKIFFESHDPTHHMRQGRDRGTHYRSSIYCTTEVQFKLASDLRLSYQRLLLRGGYGPVRTEIAMLRDFYHAEHFHQQYLHRNPHRNAGQCPTSIPCDIDIQL